MLRNDWGWSFSRKAAERVTQEQTNILQVQASEIQKGILFYYIFL